MTPERDDGIAIAHAVRSGQTSAEAVITVALSRARSVGAALNCYVEVLERSALEDARRVDARLKAGAEPGPLAGVPFAVKNLFDVAGVVTLAGSKINRDHPPAQEDATAVRRLRDAGAVLVGTLGMDEYAYGFTNENSHYGPVRNPHDPACMPGGSSGGSGAAVASGCVPIALGTDTNGSVRVPASLCGLFGLKPTFGRISRAGTAPFVPSLDHVGVLTRSVRDAALVFDLANGPDPRDPASSARSREGVGATLDQGIAGLRIGRAVGYFEEEATAEALEAVRAVARALGAKTEHVVAEARTARYAAMIVSAVEGSAMHFADLQCRPGDFDPMTRDRFIAGALFPGETYVRAQTFRRAYRNALMGLFAQVDVLVAPATPMVAPHIGQDEIEIDGVRLPVRPHLGRYAQPISFVGLPVVAVPTRAPGALPIGVQLIGAPYQEGALLRAARFLEANGVAKVFPSDTH
jgi:amidase/aspartyl-tRNA(Asn)/glutamyl-tRNA(Gln) amidotransferase subunit A